MKINLYKYLNKRNPKTFKKIIISIFILEILDIITTYICLKYYGLEEQNPIFYKMFANGMFYDAMLFKIIISILLVYLLWILNYSIELKQQRIKPITKTEIIDIMITDLSIWLGFCITYGVALNNLLVLIFTI